MVLLHQFSPLHSLALILLLRLLVDDAGIVHEKFVIVELFDYELFLKLIVRIDEELTSHKEKCIGHNIQKLFHCGQSDSFSFIRQHQQHSFDKG